MKTFHQFVSEAYDADLMRSASVKTTDADGRISQNRKKTASEMRRMKQAKAGETRQPSSYKPRKDIGSQPGSRSQQPTQDRGSARGAQLAAAKAERKKAALARIAAKKSVATAKSTSKELKKAGTQLLSKKKEVVDKRPADQPKRDVVGISRAERSRITKKGERRLRDLVLKSTGKKKESELKHKYVTW